MRKWCPLNFFLLRNFGLVKKRCQGDLRDNNRIHSINGSLSLERKTTIKEIFVENGDIQRAVFFGSSISITEAGIVYSHVSNAWPTVK